MGDKKGFRTLQRRVTINKADREVLNSIWDEYAKYGGEKFTTQKEQIEALFNKYIGYMDYTKKVLFSLFMHENEKQFEVSANNVYTFFLLCTVKTYFDLADSYSLADILKLLDMKDVERKLIHWNYELWG